MIVTDENGTFHAEPDYSKAELKALLDQANASLLNCLKMAPCRTKDVLVDEKLQAIAWLQRATAAEDRLKGGEK